jgi:hypothetical protein
VVTPRGSATAWSLKTSKTCKRLLATTRKFAAIYNDRRTNIASGQAQNCCFGQGDDGPRRAQARRCRKEDLEPPPVPGSVQGEIARQRGAVRVTFSAQSVLGRPLWPPLLARPTQRKPGEQQPQQGSRNESSHASRYVDQALLVTSDSLSHAGKQGDYKVATTDT